MTSPFAPRSCGTDVDSIRPATADLGLTLVTTTARTRTFSGPLGALKLSARAEGGHYTFVEATTDQMGESRMDRNVKRFFVQLHRAEDPSHTLQASY